MEADVDAAEEPGDLLGVGGQGEVKQLRLGGGIYAVNLEKARRKEPMLAELANLEAVKHHLYIMPAVGRVLGDDGCVGYVTQKANCTVDALLGLYANARAPLAPPMLYTILSHTAEAVHHMHQQEFCHFDVKADNLFLCGPPTNPRIRIGDLGLSKQRCSPDFRNPFYLQSFRGTVCFAAPEMAALLCEDLERELHDHPSYPADVYSFGLLALECLTLSQPFEGWTDHELAYCGEEREECLNKALEGSLIFGQYPEEVRSCYKGLVLWCTDNIVGIRPTMSEVVEMLRENKQVLTPGREALLDTPARGCAPLPCNC